jgi:hypothetical protein
VPPVNQGQRDVQPVLLGAGEPAPLAPRAGVRFAADYICGQ